MEEKIDTLSSAVGNLQQLLVDHGVFQSNRKENEAKQLTPAPKASSRKREATGGKLPVDISERQSQSEVESETTIYRNVVRRAADEEMEQMNSLDPEVTFNLKKRDSSSSEDRVDTSDELIGH